MCVGMMFDCGAQFWFDVKFSFQSTFEEHYFHIAESDFVVGKGTGKLDSWTSIDEVFT